MILASRFVFSKDKFSSYINYIDRSEAIRNSAFDSYSAYVDDYMDNPKKQKPQFNTKSERTSALFTGTKDRLSPEEKKNLKKQFERAQAADSPMWQNVLSFDNEFLEQHGIYDSKTGMVDEAKMRGITRLAMKEMLKNEGMEASAVWSASIHFNTDNIHVHIAVVEPSPTRKKKDFFVKEKDSTGEIKSQFKGCLKKGTFKKMKSKVVNNIVDRSDQLKEINEIIRKNILSQKKDNLSYEDAQMKGAFLNIYNKLPSDKRMWFYNMNALHDVRPDIDAFTKQYIERYHKDDFEKLKTRLKEEQNFLKSVYGAGKTKLYENYADNKISDLYTRMGNALLTEMRQYDKLIKPDRTKGKHSAQAIQRLREKKHLSRSRSDSLNELKKALKKNYTSARSQMEFRKLQQAIEQAGQDYEDR